METQNRYSGLIYKHPKFEAGVNNAGFTEYDLVPIMDANPHHPNHSGNFALSVTVLVTSGAGEVQLAHSSASGAAGYYQICNTSVAAVMSFPAESKVKSIWIRTTGGAHDLNFTVEYTVKK